jgi:hypothetical protein
MPQSLSQHFVAMRGGTMRASTEGTMAAALVAELVATGIVAGLGPAFPREVDAGAGWSFLTTHGFELARRTSPTLHSR